MEILRSMLDQNGGETNANTSGGNVLISGGKSNTNGGSIILNSSLSSSSSGDLFFFICVFGWN